MAQKEASTENRIVRRLMHAITRSLKQRHGQHSPAYQAWTGTIQPLVRRDLKSILKEELD